MARAGGRALFLVTSIVVALAASAVAALAAAAPPAQPPPGAVLAVAGASVPAGPAVPGCPAGDTCVSVQEYQRVLAQSRKQMGRAAEGRVREMTIGSILDQIWIQGEAAEVGISVTARQVRRQLAQVRRQQFKSAAEYRRFIRRSGYTREDVHTRVRLQLLSDRLERRVAEGVPRRRRQRAFSEYIRAYRDKWTARTLCAPEYATTRCPAAPATPPPPA